MVGTVANQREGSCPVEKIMDHLAVSLQCFMLCVLGEYGIHIREKEDLLYWSATWRGCNPRFTLGITGIVRHPADCRCCPQG